MISTCVDEILKVTSTGLFENKKLNDVGGLQQNSDGTTYFGRFVNGQKKGYGIEYNMEEDSFTIGNYDAAETIGYCHLKMSDGMRYSGELFNGLWHGHGMYHWADGSYYVGQFYYGDIQGQGVYCGQNDGVVFVGEFHKGKFSGEGVLAATDLYVGSFRRGLKQGEGAQKDFVGPVVRRQWNEADLADVADRLRIEAEEKAEESVE